MKKRLTEAKGNWVKELPAVLWAYRTTPKHSTGLSPFHLTYGTKAVLPTELMAPTSRTMAMEIDGNDKALSEEKAWMEEMRDAAVKHHTADQEEIKKRYDKKVKRREFKVGDWVLRKVSRLTQQGKLDENWQGPYIVEKVGTKGAYILKDMEGARLDYPWNATHLKLFYR
ncbi:hypothetical protein ACHQM5_029121 [Ranunculus cassubicifolius]